MSDLTFLLEYLNPVILGICLCTGYALKNAFDWFDNRYIPLSALTMGAIISILVNYPGINAQVILGGMISGLASTGLYEMLHNLIDKDGKSK